MNTKKMLSPMPNYLCINVTKLYSKDTKSRFYYGHTNMLMNISTTNNENRIFKYELSNAKSMFHFRMEF